MPDSRPSGGSYAVARGRRWCIVLAMAKATCALCGARNGVMRVYIGMQHPKPNLIAISCTECGEVSSQLRTLTEYATFAVVYGLITLGLLIVGILAIDDALEVYWTATIAAILPFTFLPAWWATRQADALAAAAPQEDITFGQKIGYTTVALLIISGLLGSGLAVFLIYGRG